MTEILIELRYSGKCILFFVDLIFHGALIFVGLIFVGLIFVVERNHEN